MKIEVNKIMNPAFLLGTAFNIAYWHRKYHSGTICKGVSNPQNGKLSGSSDYKRQKKRRDRETEESYIQGCIILK